MRASALWWTVLKTGISEFVRVESDEGLRRASIGNDLGRVAQGELVVIVLENLVAITEPVQLRVRRI